MARFNLLGNLLSGRNPKDTAQSRTNVYLDIKPGGGDKANVVAYSLPGLNWWATGESRPIRGMIPCANTVGGLAVVTNRDAGGGDEEPIIRVYWGASDDYDEVALDTAAAAPIDTSPVVMAWGASAAAENQIVVALGTSDIVVYDVPTNAVSSPTTTWTDVVDWVAFLDGRFIAPGNQASYPGRFYWSALYDASSWNDLDFATAESYADKLTRGVVHRGILVLFGERTTEFWGGTGDSTQPFAPVAGTASNFGLSPNDLRSVQILNGQLLFVATMPNGERAVCVLNGYEAAPVSSPDLEYRLATLHNGEASTSAAFRMAGHDFYLLNFETATYVYDATSGVWSVWKSPGRDRCQITCASAFVSGASSSTATLPGTYASGTTWTASRALAAITAVRYGSAAVPTNQWIGAPNAGTVEIAGDWFSVTADVTTIEPGSETIPWLSGRVYQLTASPSTVSSISALILAGSAQSATYAGPTITVTAPLAASVRMYGTPWGGGSGDMWVDCILVSGFVYRLPVEYTPDFVPIYLELGGYGLPIPADYDPDTGYFTITSLQGAPATATVARLRNYSGEACTHSEGATWDCGRDFHRVNSLKINGVGGHRYTYDATANTITVTRFGAEVAMDAVLAFTPSTALVMAGSLDGNLYTLDSRSGKEPDPAGELTDVDREIIMPHLYDGDGWAKVLVPRLRIEADNDGAEGYGIAPPSSAVLSAPVRIAFESAGIVGESGTMSSTIQVAFEAAGAAGDFASLSAGIRVASSMEGVVGQFASVEAGINIVFSAEGEVS